MCGEFTRVRGVNDPSVQDVSEPPIRVVLGSDHGGLSLKNELAQYLSSQAIVVTDLGTHTADSVDYPEFGAAVGRTVAAGDADPLDQRSCNTFSPAGGTTVHNLATLRH